MFDAYSHRHADTHAVAHCGTVNAGVCVYVEYKLIDIDTRTSTQAQAQAHTLAYTHPHAHTY